jgi:hypothetical protein
VGSKLVSSKTLDGNGVKPCQAGLPGPKKFKRPNLAISSFKKGQILKNEKRPNKGQISLKKFVNRTKLKLIIS